MNEKNIQFYRVRKTGWWRSNVKKLKTYMNKALLFWIALSISLLLISCSKDEEPAAGPSPQPKPIAVIQKEEPGQVEEEPAEKKTARIRAALISPVTPRTDSRITVTTDIFPPLDTEDGESLSYVFYKNTEIFKEQEANDLPPGSAVKGDSVFADVIIRRGGEELDKKRSSIVFLLNSKPEIGEIEFPEINGLGTYTITVNASDADDDPLIFSLDKKYGVPSGMTIAEETGLITYIITQPPEQDIKFKVVVNDGDGGDHWREWFIKFSIPGKNREKNY
jgi:hypothetical protein